MDAEEAARDDAIRTIAEAALRAWERHVEGGGADGGDAADGREGGETVAA